MSFTSYAKHFTSTNDCPAGNIAGGSSLASEATEVIIAPNQGEKKIEISTGYSFLRESISTGEKGTSPPVDLGLPLNTYAIRKRPQTPRAKRLKTQTPLRLVRSKTRRNGP